MQCSSNFVMIRTAAALHCVANGFWLGFGVWSFHTRGPQHRTHHAIALFRGSPPKRDPCLLESVAHISLRKELPRFSDLQLIFHLSGYVS